MHLFCRWRLHRKWGFLLRCSSAFLKPTFHLTLLWFSVVTVLCDFLCNVMRKVQQKQWQIFCRKFLRKSVRLENQKVTIDLLFPFNSSILVNYLKKGFIFCAKYMQNSILPLTKDWKDQCGDEYVKYSGVEYRVVDTTLIHP